MACGHQMSRRAFVQGMVAGVGGLLVASRPLRAAKSLVVGFIYVGPRDDFGYNQAHAQGAAAAAKLADVKIIEEENVAETVAVQKSMESMIALDGVTLLFPTSFGYFDPHILKVAGKFPAVRFLHAGGLYQEGKHPKNVGSYFGYIDEAQYLSGIVAGYTSKTGKLGFVAAKPIPQVLRNINAFTLAARSVRPQTTTQVIFTGDWAMPVREAEATNSLVDQGIDVITCHVDSPKVVIETCERRAFLLRLSRQSSAAGAAWLSDGRRVELGRRVYGLCQKGHGPRNYPQPGAGWPAGGHRQNLRLWSGRSTEARQHRKSKPSLWPAAL